MTLDTDHPVGWVDFHFTRDTQPYSRYCLPEEGDQLKGFLLLTQAAHLTPTSHNSTNPEEKAGTT